MMWKHIICVKKIVLRFTSVVVVMTTKKIVGPPDPLSWWSCGPLLIKVCVNPWKGPQHACSTHLFKHLLQQLWN